MAVQFMDSFDHYATADMLKKYNSKAGTDQANITISNTHYRTGAYALRVTGGGFTYGEIVKTLPTPVATVIVGFWWYPDFIDNGWSPTNQGGSAALLGFYAGGTLNCRLCAWDSGTFTLERDSNLGWSQIAAGGSFTFQSGQYVEVKFTLHDTLGAIVMHVNGAEVWNQSGLDTLFSGGANLSAVSFLGCGRRNAYSYYDDLYIADITGSYNNDFLGDVQVIALLPDGNGNSSDWDGSDGNSVDNYALVDEDVLSEADYVESDTVGDTDTYTYDDLVSEDPLAIQFAIDADKTDVGDKFVRGIARISGTDYETADMAVSTTKTIMTKVMDYNPATSSDWTRAAVNAAEFGVHHEA